MRRENLRLTNRDVWLDLKLEGSEMVTFILVSLYELEEVDTPDPLKYSESGLILLPRNGGEG